MKKLLAGILILIGCCSSAYYIQSQSKDLSLEVIKECELHVAGDKCIAEYEIVNSTNESLDGIATLHIDYQGVCGEFPFDGEGIIVSYNNMLSSEWNEGSVSFPDLIIPIGTSSSALEMTTAQNLCPGQYSYSLTLSGTADIEDAYTSSGSGSFNFIPPVKPVKRLIFDGDLIRNPNAEGLAQYDIYIVKLINDKQFKRLILNPHVFNSYAHLSWNDVKLVDQDVMDNHITSSLVRVRDYDRSIFENEVYYLIPNGDVGIKRHLNITQTEFEKRGYDADSVYNINIIDKDAYATGESIL